MEKSEKKPKEMDRISTLPDSVLCHILSFLPTRASMATSILSRRWRHLWKDLQVLDVDQDQSFRVPDGERRFIDFVDAVLARRTSPHIRKFRLSCRVSQREVLDGWSSGIGPHLQELQLSLPSCNPYHRLNENFNFWKCPGAALTSTSLVSLVLKGCVDLNYHFPVQDVHLPSLKNLEVDVCLMNIDKVLSGCPVVENLKLVLQNIFNPARIRIPQSVKRLTLDDQGVEDFDDVVDIEIDNPSLEYLNLLVGRENICLKILVRDFLNMVEAHVFNAGHYFDDDGGWVPELFKALYMTNSLSFTNNTMECLRPAPGLEIPEFCRLVHLDFCSYDFNGKLLLEFLHKCNMLQFLIYRRGDYDYEDDPVDRTPPTKVPNCMISHLKTFEFDGYLDSEDERAFIAYVLQEGLVLKTMKIRSQGFDINKKFLVLKELSAIPRGSNTCQLIFD